MASTAAETVTFNNPTGTLTIDGGDTGINTINIGALANPYPASIDIDGGNGGDTVNFNGAITLAAGKSLTVDAKTINAPNAGSDIAGSASGTIGLTATRNILLSSGSSLTTVNGGITLNANTAGTTLGDFVGIELDDADLTTTDGVISLNGQGGNGSADNRGVYLHNGSTISSVSGTIMITGTGGGDGTDDDHEGIRISDGAQINSTGTGINAATITLHGTGGTGDDRVYGVTMTGSSGSAPQVTSVDGNIQITGIGGTAADDFAAGVRQAAGALVRSTGTGTNAATITIMGIGGTGDANNQGIRLSDAATTISTVDGDITLTGVAGGSGSSNHGIRSESLIRSTGTGHITMTGTGSAGGTGDGVNIRGSSVVETTSSGAIQITGTGSGSDPGLDIDGTLGAAAGTGSVTLISNTISIDSAATLQGAGALTIKPSTSSTTLGLGGGTGTLNIDDTELARLADGFSSITIGDATSGDIDVDTATFNDPLNLITGGEVHDGSGTDINMASGDTVTVNGTVAPGQSPGILLVSGNFAFADNATFEVEIGGTTPGNTANDHDQIDATGSVTIGTNVALTTLALGGFVPLGGESFEADSTHKCNK